jgi:hypothetical protein
MDWWERLKRMQAGLTGLIQPTAPSMGDYMTQRPGDMPAMLSYTPKWEEGGQLAYQSANTDYEDAMAAMRQDAAEHVQSWANKMAPAPGDIGQYRKGPESLSVVDRMTGKAPVDEMALYGRPQEFPGIGSITNLRRRKEMGYV